MRRAAKIDANQPDIVTALRQYGATVHSLAQVGNGCPDIVVGYNGKNYLFEIKDGNKPQSRRKLTEAEARWHAEWQGQVTVVASPREAIIHIKDHS